MKTLFMLSLIVFASSASAIDFFTEADVARELGAETAIAVNKYKVESLLSSECRGIIHSRSARTYIVKVSSGDVAVYATPERLADLTRCSDLW